MYTAQTHVSPHVLSAREREGESVLNIRKKNTQATAAASRNAAYAFVTRTRVCTNTHHTTHMKANEGMMAYYVHTT